LFSPLLKIFQLSFMREHNSLTKLIKITCPGQFWNIWYIDSKKIYLKLLLISFNHVNKVIDVYTYHKPKAFVCVFIKLVYDCIQWNLKVSVNMTVAMPRVIVFPVPLWRVDISLHVSKRWNIFRLLLVEGGIVSKIFKMQ
jgi:hypothetical protein